jgi:hypothetical protein
MPMVVPEIVAFAKPNGVLSKRISLDADGKPVSDGSACVMARGTARRQVIADIGDLGTFIGAMKSNEALALGALRLGVPNTVGVATKRQLNGSAGNGFIARTGENIVFRRGVPGYVLIDYDSKGMPPDVARRLSDAGGFWGALASVIPGLEKIARLMRASTSAGLFRTDTGARLPGSNGVHVYLAVKDASDSARFLNDLHARCWLAGFGWMMVGAGGQLLERSIVDRMVGAPERLVFEGTPILIPPLAQDAKERAPQITDGTWLDTLAACPPLTADLKAWPMNRAARWRTASKAPAPACAMNSSKSKPISLRGATASPTMRPGK